MITREQVAYLRAGDVVEYHRADWAAGVILRGPLTWSPGDTWLGLGDSPVRFKSDDVNGWALDPDTTLTVVSRAPRLYVNHDRTVPVLGDVVRDADSDSARTWCVLDTDDVPFAGRSDDGWDWFDRDQLPDRLLLLVDGETGRCVP